MKTISNILLLFGVLGLIAWILLTPKKTNQPLQTTNTESPNPMPSPKMQFTKPESVTNPTHKYTAILNTTKGEITIELSSKTPVTTNSFVFLSQKGFYDGVIFHRIVPGFMIQGGDPTGTGTGGPGYRFDDEKFEGKYVRGTVAMANSGPNTNGSQFFIMHQDYALPPDYVIFGMVIKGLDVVDKIASAKTVQDGRENSRPVEPVVIQSIKIVEN